MRRDIPKSRTDPSYVLFPTLAHLFSARSQQFTGWRIPAEKRGSEAVAGWSPAAATRLREGATGEGHELVHQLRPPNYRVTPRHAAEIDAGRLCGLELGHLNFAGLLGGSGSLRSLCDRLRSGDLVSKRANCAPKKDDRTLPALRKSLSRFFSLDIVFS